VESFGFRRSAMPSPIAESRKLTAESRPPTYQPFSQLPLMNNILLNSSEQYVLVNQKQRTFIPVSNIIMLESQSNYSVFHLKYGKKRIYAHTIRYFEGQLLDKKFIRVHNGFLINPSFVLEYNQEDSKLVMENNLEASISRRRRKSLLDIF
jgi:DNA-binding LytR/AlgR family response regulator